MAAKSVAAAEDGTASHASVDPSPAAEAEVIVNLPPPPAAVHNADVSADCQDSDAAGPSTGDIVADRWFETLILVHET